MMQGIATFVSGLLFGLGLCVSGLIDPAKVQSFLDVAGDWDPSLAITMASAVFVTGVGYRMAFGRGKPLFAGTFQIPPAGKVDRRLVAGAAIFGIGWGLVGFCPGPAVAALSVRAEPALWFVLAMLVGMAAARWFVSHTPVAARKAVVSANS